MTRKEALRVAGALGAAVVLALGVRYWLWSRGHESTDDAFIDAHVVPVASQVQGPVLAVDVEDNQQVRKGQPLLEIDPADYRVRLDQAKAELKAAEAGARKAAQDAESAEKLFAKDQVSRQAYQHAQAEAEVARAQVDVARGKAAAAELDLSYTRITAPEDGRVTRRSVEPRAFVQVGQPLMALVPSRVWVIANFKETQLARMRAGQKATVKVDAFPGRALSAHVDSIQSGTGSRFSLLPPENATGNFVKVVQRVPVKLVFDEPAERLPPLSPGMSVVPEVELGGP